MEIGILAILAAVVAARVCGPGRWIAGAVVDQVELGVVRPHEPGIGSAARRDFRRWPGIITRLARRRYGVGSPDLLAALLVVGGDRAARRVFAAGISNHHHVLDDGRRRRDVVASLVV